MKKSFLAILLALLIGACAPPPAPISNTADSKSHEKACLSVAGNYLTFFDECEDVSAASCKAMGGSFEECASACRHLPEDVMCNTQCIPVCSFGSDKPLRQPESVVAQLNNSLECNLMQAPKEIDEVTAYYICQAPGAYLTFVDVRSAPWTAGYFTTDTQSTKVTYGPERVTVELNPHKP